MKELLKTIAIILLSAGMAFLVWQTWAYEPALREALPGGRAPGDSPAPESAAPYAEWTVAVQPALLAQWRDGGRAGAFWDSAAIEQAMPLLSRALGEALGSAGAHERSDTASWAAAMTGESVYLQYTDTVPLQALGAWNSHGFPLDTRAWRLALCVEDRTLRLFYENERGQVFTCATAARGELPELALETPFRLASERPGLPADPEPLLLLPDIAPDSPGISAAWRTDMLEAAEPLLRALGIDPEMPYPLEEPDGSVTFVDYRRYCTVSPDGLIYYNNPEPDGHVPVPDPAMLGGVEAAFALCKAAGDALGDAAWELRGVTQNGDSLELRYGVHIGGCPVLGTDSAVAFFTVKEGRVAEASLYIREYRRDAAAGALLPLRQALAAVSPEEDGFALQLAYLDDGAARLSPQWILRGGAS